MAYAEVAVAAPASPGKSFSYSVPEGMHVQVGHAVQVPFGPRQLPGFVIETPERPAFPETRGITRVIDEEPWLTPWQVELAAWVSETYHASLYAAVSLMIPPGYQQKITAVYHPTERSPDAPDIALDEKLTEVLKFIRDQVSAPQPEIEGRFGKRNAGVILGQLTRRRLVHRTWAWQRPRVGPKLQRVVHLAIDRDTALEEAQRLTASRATKQGALLRAVAEAGEQGIPTPLLTSQVGTPGQGLKALVERGMVTIDTTRVERDPLAGKRYPQTWAPILTAHQEEAWRQIAGALASAGAGPTNDPTTWLLFGVTGSGKTEIYLRALEQVVRQGKKAIVLVPEIALTPQTIERFAGRFPGRVAVLHSHLSQGEQFDEWWRIRHGEFDVVVGARGAVFAPQPDLGLIVLDEEHEWTYKQQEQQPHYHARDVAIHLARLTGAHVILGSATPSIESFHRAQIGQYRLLELPERIIAGEDGAVAQTIRLPMTTVVDMREEIKAGNRSIFSNALYEGIEKALDSDEQVILFLNRRGTSTFVQCRDCGYVARCRRCDATLTYHADRDHLQCHQCNQRARPPQQCPECWGRRIRYSGIGTQRLESEVIQSFPGARTLRWDRDVTRGRDAHEAILHQFQNHEADVLIGTQMLAKGLHLPRVTLVGVINADIGLYLPDFRAPERVFQVLCQVAGRSGRGPAGGRVIIQTYSPGNYAIVAAAAQDYLSFYEEEIARRMEFGLPPFTRMARLIFRHTSASYAKEEAVRVFGVLATRLAEWGYPSTKLVGPAPAPYERIRGRYRWHIVVQGPEPERLLDSLTLSEGWTIDMDPVSLL